MLESQAPKIELKNHYVKAQVIPKSFNSELLTTAIKNLEK